MRQSLSTEGMHVRRRWPGGKCHRKTFTRVEFHKPFVLPFLQFNLTRFNKIATQGAPQMAVDKETNSLSRVYSYYSKFNLRLFYV